MKIIKIIIVCLAMFAGEKLSAQNLIVNNNTPLTNGLASFGFIPGSGCDYTQPFSANTTGYSSAYSCPSSWLVDVHVTFDDPNCTPSAQGPYILSPSAPSATYIDCIGTVYTITLTLVGSDWVLDLF